LHGLKAALVARARAERVDVSVIVRRAIERELGVVAATTELAGELRSPRAADATVKLSIRLTSAEAAQLAAGAARAGLSRSAYVSGLLAEVPLLKSGSGSRPDFLAALNASCAELSTMTRNLHHLTTLLRQGQVRAAMEYREMLDTLGGDVRQHVAMAAGLLAELRPAHPTRVAFQRQPRAAA
jgi:metal-dependent amidase/aminoacylase/carboxypeptidase family protein